MLHSGFARFNSPDVRRARPTVKQSGKLVELPCGTHRVDLNAAVVLVPDPAAESDAARVLFDKPAKSHTLHPAGNKPGSRLKGRLGQLGLSRGRSAGCPAPISASTADRNPLSENGLARSRKPFSTT